MDRFASYTEAMLDIDNAKVESRAEADQILAKTEPVSWNDYSRSDQLTASDLIYAAVPIDQYEDDYRIRPPPRVSHTNLPPGRVGG